MVEGEIYRVEDSQAFDRIDQERLFLIENEKKLRRLLKKAEVISTIRGRWNETIFIDEKAYFHYDHMKGIERS